MAKSKSFIIGVLCLLTVACASGQGTVRTKLVDLAYSQLGTYEATGKNDGVMVEQYLKSVGRKKGDAWCAAFVSWNYQQCGLNNPKSGWSPDWFPKAKTIYKRDRPQSQNGVPQPGDAMGLYFKNMGRIAHVGMIYQWGDKYVITIEGNTNDAGSREGDGVYKKKRLRNQIYAVSNWIDAK